MITVTIDRALTSALLSMIRVWSMH